ncbi:uncharacterized protein MYCFIDRAFT_176291 [Pseudocercospora fijiensis CIRAD86]|uniref:Uncharacterized protein n=1 Tax=Pseudocercospora fijiensis (strain CIRAD86) TaxID=383855 RepID=M2ZPB0_PSEFD|nr:uncharacterized protein MYCFIDRAFT_176291 [Pseudocercospora fijiensis CIRAD86]EME80939.1 hypothetical protein MYCFIDRAFT_176291 [Pseudocercospora fijiensis CIRAD86]
MNANIIFLAHDEHDDQDVRRTVRVRAAEYSHRQGDRKPKAGKKPNTMKRKPKQSDPNEGSSQPQSTRNSTPSNAASAASGTQAGETDSGLALSRSQSPATGTVGNQRENSFVQYPVEAQPWFERLLDWSESAFTESFHTIRANVLGWSALDTTHAQRQEALPWVQRLTMSSPCYFYMNMLSVSSDLVSRGSLNQQMVPWHSSQVVKSINEALNDREKALAVGTILAVGRIALHEIMLGDISAGNQFHRPAWARYVRLSCMIVMAGGLDALKLPSLVRSHLGWANRLMTMKTGISIFDLEPALKHEPTFLLERQVSEDVAVLHQYMPFSAAKLCDKFEAEPCARPLLKHASQQSRYLADWKRCRTVIDERRKSYKFSQETQMRQKTLRRSNVSHHILYYLYTTSKAIIDHKVLVLPAARPTAINNPGIWHHHTEHLPSSEKELLIQIHGLPLSKDSELYV